MSFAAVHNTVRNRFQTQIAGPQSLLTEYDNRSIDYGSAEVWARATVKPGERRKVSIGTPGNSRYRQPGILIVQLFSRLDKGDGAILALADLIEAQFRSVTVSGVVFETPTTSAIGRSENWWQINVNCPFYADDIG